MNFKQLFEHQINQYVIYGATGWVGRSCLDAFVSTLSPSITSSMLLLGSKDSEISSFGKTFQVFNYREGFPKIQDGSVFINAAFLRREKTNFMDRSQYVECNNEIAAFAEMVMKARELKSFINLSSGVAKYLDKADGDKKVDLYAELKRVWELKYFEISRASDTPLVNCRIFSLSGRYINEFESLALSNFIGQAINTGKINVYSPETIRTYVRADELGLLLLRLGNTSQNIFLDTGGVLVKMKDLALRISSIIGSGIEVVCSDTTPASEYFGDYIGFNKLLSDFGISLSSIDDQIVDTLQAFRFRG